MPWREFLSRALERSGHEVTAVPDGLSALNAVSERGYDLLIADIVMPGIDGIEVSRQANKVNADLKVLFITGFSAVAKSARGVDAACQACAGSGCDAALRATRETKAQLLDALG